MSPDTIRITSLALQLSGGLGPSAFGLSPSPPCPVLANLEISLSDAVVPSCVENDNMDALGVNYSSTSKEILKLASSSSWYDPYSLIRTIAMVPLQLGEGIVKRVEVEIELPKASLVAEGILYSAKFDYEHREGIQWICKMGGLRCRTIIGLHDHERRMKQWIELDLGISGWKEGDWDHAKVSEGVYGWLEQSSFGTIEALVDRLALYLLQLPALRSPEASVQVTVRKPAALPFAMPSITIQRTHNNYTPSQALLSGTATTGTAVTNDSQHVFIALGSNIGDRIGHITSAVDTLDQAHGVKVVRTSKLYESEPMYVEDQDRFINGVVELETDLSPIDLLRVLKRTEKEIGRTKTYRNGPRVVDLDLLIYGDRVVTIGQEGDTEDEDGVGWLECPHPRISEREFVLRPLADIAQDLRIPGMDRSVDTLLRSLASSSKSTLAPIIPFSNPAQPLRLDGPPKIMQIFNATPDSFSDGSASNLDVQAALERIRAMWDVPYPPDILDIGGMSTRPNSEPCTEQEEIDRVVPLITAIRADPTLGSIPISIDTYRPAVARLAIQAGASCVNDVRGGTTPCMIDVMRKARVPIVLMHSRGDSYTMGSTDLQDYSVYGGVINGVKAELGQRVKEAVEEGVRDWNIVLDPGLGFAKSHEDNLRLLRGVKEIGERYTVLVGGSRKGFVGRAIGRSGKDEALQRGYGDAAVVAWCAARKGDESGAGVGVVRVHDGRGMGEVIRMWTAIEGAGSKQGRSLK